MTMRPPFSLPSRPSPSNFQGELQYREGPRASRRPAASDAAPCSFLEGTLYRLIGTLGEGAMGEVFLAEHTVLRRAVALKIIHARHAVDPVVVSRLIREARTIARLEHQSLARIYDLGTTRSGRLYIAMEHLEGESLRVRLRRQVRLSAREACALVLQTLDGLEVAHAAGVIHRDLKPENLFVTHHSMVKILDFGVAKLPEEDVSSELTAEGVIVGTPRYMAPEQVRGAALGPSTDLYALGCILFECLTGNPVFDHSDRRALLRMHVSTRAPRLSDRCDDLFSPELEALVVRALEKEPYARFSSARDMANALRHVLASSKPLSLTPGLVLRDSNMDQTLLDDVSPCTLLSLPMHVASSEVTASANELHDVTESLPVTQTSDSTPLYAPFEEQTLLSGRTPIDKAPRSTTPTEVLSMVNEVRVREELKAPVPETRQRWSIASKLLSCFLVLWLFSAIAFAIVRSTATNERATAATAAKYVLASMRTMATVHAVPDATRSPVFIDEMPSFSILRDAEATQTDRNTFESPEMLLRSQETVAPVVNRTRRAISFEHLAATQR